jgi:hypothetical protein
MKIQLTKYLKKTTLFLSVFLITLTLLNCNDEDGIIGESKGDNVVVNPPTGPSESSGKIAKVYFAQTHVFEPGYKVPGLNEELKLVSEREALLKVQVTSTINNEASPKVEAKLELPGQPTKTIELAGPATLKTSFESSLGKVQHSFDDSFTATIDEAYMKPGLKVTVQVGEDEKIYNNLKFGAPNKIYFNNFLFGVFSSINENLSDGWIEEFKNNLPVVDFEVQTIKINLDEITVLPIAGETIAARINSKAVYRNLTGKDFNRHNATFSPIRAALRNAAGFRNGGHQTYISTSWNYGDAQSKGESGAHASTQAIRGGEGILFHEMGHAFSLPHWADRSFYPYKGTMHGIQAGPVAAGTHAGPIWGYNSKSKKFLKPTRDGVTPLTYKNDPMQGGAKGSPEPGFSLNHFSDYSIHRIRENLDNNLVRYINGNYARWNSETSSYSKIQTNKGNITYPIVRDVNVYSVMAALSTTTPQANLAYPPIGPYKSGLIQVFDPTKSEDRSNPDAEFFCKKFRDCDYTLRVTQGGKVKHYMISMQSGLTSDPTSVYSFATRAVNVPASDGTITKIELLETLNARINGLPSNPKVLSTWTK